MREEEDDETTPTPREGNEWSVVESDGWKGDEGEAEGAQDGWGGNDDKVNENGGDWGGNGAEDDQPEDGWGVGDGKVEKTEDQVDDSSKAWDTATEEEVTTEEWKTADETSKVAEACDGTSTAWTTVQQPGDDVVSAGGNPRRASEWSMKGHGADVVDFYADDELNEHDPNMQLQIVREADEEDEEEGGRKKYPPKPMLVDQGEPET